MLQCHDDRLHTTHPKAWWISCVLPHRCYADRVWHNQLICTSDTHLQRWMRITIPQPGVRLFDDLPQMRLVRNWQCAWPAAIHMRLV
jgi:hypothetical protein